MKNVLSFVVPFVLLTAGVWFGYNYYFGGKDYYTQITSPGEVQTGKFSTGEKYTEYGYTQTAFDKNGKKRFKSLEKLEISPYGLMPI